MGASHARGFIAEGANVVIADVLEQEGRSLACELGGQAIFSRLDVTSDKDWAATVATAEEAFGPVSVLVNNAGIMISNFLFEHDLLRKTGPHFSGSCSASSSSRTGR